MPAFRLLITGHVQGVCFRAETQQLAKDLNITGWVRNTADGSVEIHAEGEEVSLNALQRWCGKGPPRAVVEKVQVFAAEPKACDGFTIERDS